MKRIQIQTHLLDPIQEGMTFQKEAIDCGAIVSFTGIVRGNDNLIPLEYLYIEHFPEVTEKEIALIVHEAHTRWDFKNCTVIHRVGKIAVQEPIVWVAVASGHRTEAFKAAEFIMDYLKTDAPFWKKEIRVDGSSQWVKAKNTDQQKKQRWLYDGK